MSSISIALRATVPPVTKVLIALNVLVFAAMWWSGAGFWHSSNSVPLAWGANFAPATADGQWWRLGSAMFLHFGALHLGMNMLALWDGGKLVERMLGSVRFLIVYLVSGVSGNLLSLVMQGNQAISGGASGAIFGIYGALLVMVWIERHRMRTQAFRWLFWGALLFSALTILMGYVVPGIDHSAHLGGFVTGMGMAVILLPDTMPFSQLFMVTQRMVGAIWLIALFVLLTHLPVPKYRWHDELAIQQQVQQFHLVDQQAQRNWRQIMLAGREGSASFDELAVQLDTQVVAPYTQSFEALSALPDDPQLPSSALLAQAKVYALKRSEAGKAAADKLRSVPFMPGRSAE